MSIRINHRTSAVRALRPLSTALVVLALAACASTRGMHTHSTAIDADQMEASHSLSSASFSAAAWPNDSWWTDFGDSQLNQLMSDALSGQPSLRIAQARVREAQAMAGVVGASLYPQVNGNLK